jgi:ADP-heptose:LPS heptosyltransferase
VNVLLVRADGIGDALACAPLVAALRDAGHTVGAVLGTANAAIYAKRAFSRVHVLERIAWPRHGSTPASRARALAELRAERYDAALIASEEVDAYTLPRDAGIARRVGFVNGVEKPLKSLWARATLTSAVVRPASARRARRHEVEALFALGAGLHGERVPTRALRRLRPLVLDDDVAPHGAVVVQASSKLEAYGLGREGFAAIVRALAAHGLRVLVVGEDAAFAGAVAEASGARSELGLDVVAWKARIAGARALVTPDSGAAHVAGMLGIPTVDCFPLGDATAFDIARWRPWAAPARTFVLDPTRRVVAIAAALARAVADLAA